MSDEQLNRVARLFTSLMYGIGAALEISPSDMATAAAVAALNANVAAHGPNGIEHMRTTADVAERQLIAEQPQQ